MPDLDADVLLVVLGMSLATYVTKAGGLWLLGRVEISPRVEAALEMLPGAVLVSILVPALLRVGPPSWIAAGVVLVAARRTDSVAVALLAGVGTVVGLRTML